MSKHNITTLEQLLCAVQHYTKAYGHKPNIQINTHTPNIKINTHKPNNVLIIVEILMSVWQKIEILIC